MRAVKGKLFVRNGQYDATNCGLRVRNNMCGVIPTNGIFLEFVPIEYSHIAVDGNYVEIKIDHCHIATMSLSRCCDVDMQIGWHSR